MLKYFVVDGASSKEEVPYSKALAVVLGTYRDCDMTRDMLTIPNRIICIDGTVLVEEIDGDRHMVLMAGLFGLVPMGYRYDEDGNRI